MNRLFFTTLCTLGFIANHACALQTFFYGLGINNENVSVFHLNVLNVTDFEVNYLII